VKARLAAASEAKKGRVTLKGLSPEGWGPALDDLQEGRLNFPAAGMIRHPHGSILSSEFPGRWHFRRTERAHDREHGTGRASTLTHAELMYARDDQHADLIRWLGERAIPAADYKFAGPGQGNRLAPVFLYPIAELVRLVWAIWPGEKDDWRGKVRKYVYGHTAGMVVGMMANAAGRVFKEAPADWLALRDGRGEFADSHLIDQFRAMGLYGAAK
jgi:hypothetical protein